MQTIEAGNYSVKQIMKFIKAEVQTSVDYIASVIDDYENTPHQSEHFSDVLLVEDYIYDPNPKGQLRKTLRGRHGVYVFVMKENLHLSHEEVRDYCNGCSGAGFPDHRERELAAGQHFYQGSATSQSFQTRIKDHYSVNSEVSAIRLNNPHRIIVKDKLKLFLFPVVRELNDESFFIRMIEAELHRRFPAATGSNRT